MSAGIFMYINWNLIKLVKFITKLIMTLLGIHLELYKQSYSLRKNLRIIIFIYIQMLVKSIEKTKTKVLGTKEQRTIRIENETL